MHHSSNRIESNRIHQQQQQHNNKSLTSQATPAYPTAWNSQSHLPVGEAEGATSTCRFCVRGLVFCRGSIWIVCPWFVVVEYRVVAVCGCCNYSDLAWSMDDDAHKSPACTVFRVNSLCDGTVRWCAQRLPMFHVESNPEGPFEGTFGEKRVCFGVNIAIFVDLSDVKMRHIHLSPHATRFYGNSTQHTATYYLKQPWWTTAVSTDRIQPYNLQGPSCIKRSQDPSFSIVEW